MAFLPIARRELRVAAAKRGTFWIRLGGALAALLIGSMGFAIQMGNGATAMVGRSLFGILTLLACFAALSAGLVFTSDSLSEEKREGTLGFLFLTDLRGYDVVSGKLLSAALRGLYMLFAAFPVVAIPLLMGGVTGVAFWKAGLALLNALFASLVAGVFISSISREAQKAMFGTTLLLFAWCGAGYLIDALISTTFFRLSSPFFVFTRANRSVFFWEALLVNQVITWGLFAASCYFAARTWHDKPQRTTSAFAAFGHWLKYGSARRRERLRVKLMNVNPVTWLACRERWQTASFWVIAALLLGALTTISLASPPAFRLQFWAFASMGLTLILYLGFASQACRFFAEARKNALLEVLLSTPLRGEQIVQGQWLATLRMFGSPLTAFLAAYFIGTVLMNEPMTNPFKSLGHGFAALLVVAADLAALTWFGMWMGLVSKNVNAAAWKTIFFVQVIPWFVLTFLTAMLLPLWARSANLAWMQLISFAVPTVGSLAIDGWLIYFARRKLDGHLRQRAAN